jgi:hypothetical protein
MDFFSLSKNLSRKDWIMKQENRIFAALFVLSCLMAGTSFAATLTVVTDTLGSSTYAPGRSDPIDVQFSSTGLNVTATGQNFLLLSIFTTSNSASAEGANRQGRWQITTDYAGGAYTYTNALSMTGSAIYERWINGSENTEDHDYGVINMNGIYDLGTSGSHTFDLYHRSDNGAAIVTQNGSMVVVGLDVGDTTLRYGTVRQDATVAIDGPVVYESRTTSTAWSRVERTAGVELDANVDISEQGGKIFVAASINSNQITAGVDGVTGAWQLVLCNSSGVELERLGTTIKRTIDNATKDSAAAMAYAMTSDLAAGEYIVTLEQKILTSEGGQGIATFNATINAVGLTIQDGSDAGQYFEEFTAGSEGSSDQNSTDTLTAALTVSGLNASDTGIVAATNFTSEGSGLATGRMELAYGGVDMAPLAQRTISGSDIFGAGGLVGYVESGGGAEDLELLFANSTGDGAVTLNLINSSLVGFNTTSVPEPATLGLLAIGGIAMLRRKRAG